MANSLASTGTAAQVSASVITTEDSAELPLLVIIRPYLLDFSEYRGSRAQLEAEGIVPAGTEWPEGGRCVKWEQGLLRFSLSRTRPAGMKGPKKLWLEGDYWSLRWKRKVQPDWGTVAIREKVAELAQEVYRQSYEGRRTHQALWDSFWKAHEDKAFQSFKNSIVPHRKKPGHPAKSSTTEQSQGASA